MCVLTLSFNDSLSDGGSAFICHWFNISETSATNLCKRGLIVFSVVLTATKKMFFLTSFQENEQLRGKGVHHINFSTYPPAGSWGSCSSECCSPQRAARYLWTQTVGSSRLTWTGCVPSWKQRWMRMWWCCWCIPWYGRPGRWLSALGFSCHASSPSPAPTRWSCRPRPGRGAPPLAALRPAGSTRRWSLASPAPRWTLPAALWPAWKPEESRFELGPNLGLASHQRSG